MVRGYRKDLHSVSAVPGGIELVGMPGEVLDDGKRPSSQNNKIRTMSYSGRIRKIPSWERWTYQRWNEQGPGLGRHKPQEAVITGDAANESSLGPNSIEMSASCPPHSNHLLDEAPLAENCSDKLNTSEPWIAICQTSTDNPIKIRLSIWPSGRRGHTLNLAGRIQLLGRVAACRHIGSHSAV